MDVKNSIIEINDLVKVYPRNKKKSIIELFKKKQQEDDSTDKRFYRKSAIDHVSFKIPKGSRFGIIGHNGSGKSTLLSLMLGILKPDKGTLKINGRPLGLLELGSGFHPDLTGKENIYLYSSILGNRIKETHNIISKVAEFSELGSSLDRSIRTYSSGMVVRLAFSVLAFIKSDILLIDEILGVGDFQFQLKCLNYFEEFSKNGGTIVFVSQDYKTILNFCNYCICLNKGKIISYGPVKKVVKVFREDMEKIKKQYVDEIF